MGLNTHAVDWIASGLELKPHRNLADAGCKTRGDGAKADGAEVEVRLIEIDVVENIGEGSLGAQLEFVGKGEGFDQAGVQVDVTGANDRSDLRVAEAADRKRGRTCTATGGAGCADGPSGKSRTGEGSSVDPVAAVLSRRLPANACNIICMLSAVAWSQPAAVESSPEPVPEVSPSPEGK